MSHDPYAFEDPYTYPNSHVLRNKFGIEDEDELEKRERLLTLERTRTAPKTVQATAADFLSLHQHLFQDVYDWAGEYRTVRISKGRTPFCFPEYIERSLVTALAQMDADDRIAGQELWEVARALAPHINELNLTHPFRDGNGRHLRLFIELYLAGKGHTLDFRRVRPDDFLNACVAGAAADNDPMAVVIYKALTRVGGDTPRTDRTRSID